MMDDSEKDDDLWSKVVRSVTPLKDRDDAYLPEDKNDESKTGQANENGGKDHKSQTSSLKAENLSLPTGEEMPSRQSDNSPPGREIDKRSAIKLKRGQYPIEARLDLHGLRRHEAHQQLKDFLQACYSRQKRCVIVITGKGERPGTSQQSYEQPIQKGVLRQSLPGWMDDPDLRSIVLAYHKAQPKHGGEGAFYVLLRRQRK